jgi:hypothetical protein
LKEEVSDISSFLFQFNALICLLLATGEKRPDQQENFPIKNKSSSGTEKIKSQKEKDEAAVESRSK